MPSLIRKFVLAFVLFITSLGYAREPVAWSKPVQIFTSMGTFITQNPQVLFHQKKINALWVYKDFLYGKTPIDNSFSFFALGITPIYCQIGQNGPEEHPWILFKYKRNSTPSSIFTAPLDDFLAGQREVPNSQMAVNPRLGLNPQGNAAVVYEQTGKVFASTFDLSQGNWEEPSILSEVAGINPHVALSKSKVGVVWVQKDLTTHIFVALKKLNSSKDFSTIAQIPVGNETVDSINLIWTNSGRTLVALWQQGSIIYAANSAFGWKPVPLIDKVATDSLQVASNNVKEKIALLWKSDSSLADLGISTALLRVDNTFPRIKKAKKTNFYLSQISHVPNSVGANGINLAVNERGDAIVVYLQNQSLILKGAVFVSSATKFKNWTEPQALLPPSSNPALFTAAAINKSGCRAAAMWVVGNTVSISKGTFK